MKKEKTREQDDDDDDDIEIDYPSDWEEGTTWDGKPYPVSIDQIPMNINLGNVQTTNFFKTSEAGDHGTGRIISFPNWIQVTNHVFHFHFYLCSVTSSTKLRV